MKQQNRIWSTYYEINAQFHGSTPDSFKEIRDLTGAQIPSFLKSQSSVIDARVDKFNQALKQLK
jgi:hypothetical protein